MTNIILYLSLLLHFIIHNLPLLYYLTRSAIANLCLAYFFYLAERNWRKLQDLPNPPCRKVANFLPADKSPLISPLLSSPLPPSNFLPTDKSFLISPLLLFPLSLCWFIHDRGTHFPFVLEQRNEHILVHNHKDIAKTPIIFLIWK